MMWSEGTARKDGVISVTGSYHAGGGEHWGWRTTFEQDKEVLRMRAINIEPNGKEHPAIETDWRRAS